MNKPLRNTFLAVLCLVQLAVPLSMVWQHEQTRREGSIWRFKTAPVDPADPFRGRYVRLRFAAESEPVLIDGGDVQHSYLADEARAYAELATDDAGYAKLVRLHAQRPDHGEYLDVFVMRMRYTDITKPGSKDLPPAAYVRLPFDRYYLPEAQAPQVEAAYARANREAQARTWAEVRVREGHAALMSLVLDGQALRPQ